MILIKIISKTVPRRLFDNSDPGWELALNWLRAIIKQMMTEFNETLAEVGFS